MTDLKFSVSMCVYGKDDPEWFRVAVNSILNQTCKPDEIVLVVDGPVPEELDKVIKEFEKDSMFNVIRFAENKGHGISRRVGLENCSHELVALMDSDDISLPDRFEKQLKVFRDAPDVSLVGGDITEFVNSPDNIVGIRSVPADDVEIKEYMKKRCPMNQVTVMMKKSDVEAVGGYVDWYCNEDYYLWIRLYLNNCKFANTGSVLVNVRVGEDMYQRRGGKKYFKSEAKLQKYMLDNKIIGFSTYSVNVLKRFIVQVLLPNKVRGYVFKKFAREKV